jgi:hypothetical protein
MEIIKNFLYPNKNDILDPLSLIIKLFIYSYKPNGTKISILNNKLDIQETSIFQSTIRSIKGDTKNDIINMLFPLTYACEIYLSTLDEDKNKDKYKYIFEQTIKAFDKLNELYQINEITHNIEQLKNIVTNFLSNKKFNPKTIILNWEEPSSILKKSFYNQTNSIWTSDRLCILFGYINEISNVASDELIEYLIFSLSSYMNYIDLLIVKLINNLHLLR